MKTFALLAVALLLCAGCAPIPGAGDTTGEPGGPEVDTFTLIDTAVAQGRIDYSTGMLYKVYAQYDPVNLPDEYRSDAIGMVGAPLVTEIERNWHRILPEHRAEISQYIEHLLDLNDSDTQLDDVTPDRLDQERNRID
jgi:hypothetical protein